LPVTKDVSYAETVQRQHNDINYASRITMTTTVTLREVGRKQEYKNARGRKMEIIRSRELLQEDRD
jgi:cell division ATPase FtsA